MSDMNSIVYVVDDDVSVRESLEQLICGAGWRPRVFASAEEFLSEPRHPCPSCLVLEPLLPGLDGLGLQQQLAHERVDMPIIFIAAHADVATTVRAMKAGAMEFLTKPFSERTLLEAIASALDRSRLLHSAALEIRTLQQRYEGLSKREREVMGRVVSGVINKRIGAELGISEITVKTHRGEAMRKMRARSLAELVLIAASLRAFQDGLSSRPSDHTPHCLDPVGQFGSCNRLSSQARIALGRATCASSR